MDDIDDIFQSEKPVRVPYPDHPHRCQAVSAGGDQCWFHVWGPVDSRYCKMHGGASAKRQAERKAMSMYNLAKYQAEVERFGSHESIFSLRDEIGVLRMTLQSLFKGFQGDADILINTGRISQLVGQIHKVVVDARKLESQLGELMDKAAIQRLCDSIITIVTKYVPADKLPMVADEIGGAIAQAIMDREKS